MQIQKMKSRLRLRKLPRHAIAGCRASPPAPYTVGLARRVVILPCSLLISNMAPKGRARALGAMRVPCSYSPLYLAEQDQILVIYD